MKRLCWKSIETFRKGHLEIQMGKMSLKKIKKALTMVLTASVALSAAGCGKDVAKNNMTEEKTVETTVQESSRTIVRCGTTKGF